MEEGSRDSSPRHIWASALFFFTTGFFELVAAGIGVFFLSGGVEFTILWSWEVIVEEEASGATTIAPLPSPGPITLEAQATDSIHPSPFLAPPPLDSTRGAQEEGASSTELVAFPQPSFIPTSPLPVTIANQVGLIAREAWWRIADLGLGSTSLTRPKVVSVKRIIRSLRIVADMDFSNGTSVNTSA